MSLTNLPVETLVTIFTQLQASTLFPLLFVNRTLHFIIKQILDSKIHQSMSEARVNIVIPIRGASYNSYHRSLSLCKPERKIEVTTGRVLYSFNSASGEAYQTLPLSKSYVVLKFPETGNSDPKILKAIFETSELTYSSDEDTGDELVAQHRDEEHHEEDDSEEYSEEEEVQDDGEYGEDAIESIENTEDVNDELNTVTGEDVYEEVEGDVYPDMEENVYDDIEETILEIIDETVKDNIQAEENEDKMQSNKSKLVRVRNYYRREFRLGNRKLSQPQSFGNAFKKSGTLYIDHEFFPKFSINYVYDVWFYAQDFYSFDFDRYKPCSPA